MHDRPFSDFHLLPIQLFNVSVIMCSSAVIMFFIFILPFAYSQKILMFKIMKFVIKVMQLSKWMMNILQL